MAGQESVADMEALLSSFKEGPVLTMINKRLRALKKKYNKIMQIEESKAQGKQINKEQEEVLKSKLAVGVLIEEYEKLRPALKEEIDKELMEFRLQLEEESIKGDEENVNAHLEEKEMMETTLEKVDTNVEIDEENAGIERVTEGDAVCEEGLSVENSIDIAEDDGLQSREPLESGTVPFEHEVNDLLHLLYFAQLFDVRLADASPSVVWTKIHERSSCVSYDCVTEEDSSSPLEESDLNDLSLLGSLMTSRPPNATLSHQDALQQCARHALLWLGNSDAPIKEGLRVTYSDLRERLSRILSSEYYTMTPELQTFAQQTMAAAASGSGQYPPQLLIQAALTGAGPPLYYASQDASSEPLLLGGEHYTAPLPMRNLVSESSDSPFGMSTTPAHVLESNVPVKVEVEATTGFTIIKEEQQQDLQSASTEPPQTGAGQETQEQQQELEATSLNLDTRVYQGPNGGVAPGNNHVRARSTTNTRGGYGMTRGGQGNARGSQSYDQRGYYPRNQNGRGSGRGMRASGSSTYNGYTNGQAPNRTSGAAPM